MNSIEGMIEDLEREETHIGGCTTEGEIIALLRNLENCICITPSATNGDMIKAVFPNGNEEYRGGLISYHMPKDNCVYEFLTDWWNSPYKECEE